MDRRRVREELLLEEAELDRHLERTFELSLDLMLVAAGSPLRAAQAPHLVKALGWCSVVRDYDEDMSLGLINIPAPHWVGGTGDQWLAQRHVLAEQHLALAHAELNALKGQPGQALLGIFLSSVKGYARREGARRRSRKASG